MYKGTICVEFGGTTGNTTVLSSEFPVSLNGSLNCFYLVSAAAKLVPPGLEGRKWLLEPREQRVLLSNPIWESSNLGRKSTATLQREEEGLST